MATTQQDNRSFFDKLFPHTELIMFDGKVQESGTGHTLANGKFTRERWVKVNDTILFGADENLYQASYGHHVQVVADPEGRVIAYKNNDTGLMSKASSTSAIGAIALVILLTAIAYFGGIWNFIWKGFDIWWLTVAIITLFSLYAVVWTPVYVTKELGRQRRAHNMIK